MCAVGEEAAPAAAAAAADDDDDDQASASALAQAATLLVRDRAITMTETAANAVELIGRKAEI